MRLEQHLAKTPAGLVQRIAQRLLALKVGMLLNALAGRPLRSLVASVGVPDRDWINDAWDIFDGGG